MTRTTSKDIERINETAKNHFKRQYPHIGSRYNYYAIDIMDKERPYSVVCTYTAGLSAKEACALVEAMISGSNMGGQ